MAFKSLVILDLESSGLPDFGTKPKITELSVVGVLVNHVIETKKTGRGLPRVQQKLNLCFYPQRRIDFEASEITGLDNFLLEEIPPWNAAACALFSSFMLRLPRPICMVAHNGMKFDFPLLKAEFGAKNEALWQDVRCADSLLAFRAMFPLKSPTSIYSTVSANTSQSFLSSSSKPHLNGSSSDLLRSKSEPLPPVLPEASSTSKDGSDMQRINETTPKQSSSCDFQGNPPPLKKRSICAGDEDSRIKTSVRKKLFDGIGKPRSHKLVDLYSFILNKEQIEGHRAENDSLALLECIIETAPEFLSWIEKNNYSFTKIPCMWQ